MSTSTSEKYIGPALVVVITMIVLVAARKKWASRRPPYPPGPKGYPIIGNLFDFPTSKGPLWEGFARMAKEYDTDILCFNIMGSPLIVLSSPDVAADLLERRSAVYSDKPRMPLLNELLGFSWTFSLMRYGNTWRIHRRLFHRFFNVSVADQFDDKIYNAIDVFLRRLSETPERFLEHARFLTGSLALTVAYGVNAESENDKFYAASGDAMNAIKTALTGRAFLVDVFPILMYVPEWFPGASFKRFARVAKEKLGKSTNLPFQHVKQSLEAGTLTTPSIVAECLEELPELSGGGIDEEAIRGVSGTVYLGGEDTTSSAVKWFFLAMTLYPEVVRLAQRELDEVMGRERLPGFSDKPRLPYISAIMKEVLRWGPPTPLGFLRRAMKDDVYRGFLIPAGTAVMGNNWAMFHDESIYPDANTFNPSRFLKDGQIDPDVRDPEQVIFGWGRRICPGRHFVLRLLFLTIARTLATFDISKRLDEDGNPIVPDIKCTLVGICHPLPFVADIKPRSAQALSPVAGH